MNLKKKIGGGLLAAALGASLIGGGTFALFTDSVTNTGNTFTAGTVSIDDLTGNGNVFTSALYVSNLAPGDNETGTITVQNNGSLDAWVRIDTANSTTSGTLFGGATPMQITYAANVVLVPAGGQTTLDVEYNLPLAADNSYQGATGTINVAVQAVQSRNNTNVTNTAPNIWN
jgi:spore coat-associated protein N